MIVYQYNYSDVSVTELNQFWNDIKFEKFVPRKYSTYELNIDNFANDIITRIKKPAFVLPEMLTEREKRQHAAFIIYPNKLMDNFISDGLSVDEQVYDEKLIIDKDSKSKILNQLRFLGISKEFLFPEIDQMCQSIKQQTINLIK